MKNSDNKESGNNENKISVLSPSLPKGGGALQASGEKIQIQEFSGSAGFTVALPISPCRNIAPSLAVSYSTGFGNSSFGLGWNMAISNISRRTSYGIPRYNDTPISEQRFDDTFMLDNSQDLVPVAGTAGNYNYTIDGQQYHIQAYYLRNEGAFFVN